MEARTFKVIVGVLTVAFTGLSLLALNEAGYWGIIAGQLSTWAGMQVLADVVLACSVASVWMWRDARKNGRTVWPYLVLTLVAGSFGPLLYLLLRPSRHPVAAASAA